jgi:hypothetical protein
MKKLNILLVLLCCNHVFAQFNYDAVIVGENVRMRSSSDINGKIISTLNTGVVVKILQQTNVRDIIKIGNDMCDDWGYYWYEVQTPSSQTGWVYGAFIYSIVNEPAYDTKPLINKAYKINGKSFYLSLAKINSYGIADENGLTGCDEPSIPFFYTKNESKMYPIQFVSKNDDNSGSLLVTKDKKWLLMYSGEGGSDAISEIVVENNTILMTIKRSFQDGGAVAKLILNFKGTYFEAVEDSYTNLPGY